MNQYPTDLPQTFSILRVPYWHTRLQLAASALERRYADQPIPISEWTLTYDLLRDQKDSRQVGGGTGDGFTEWQELAGFYLQQNGPNIPFFFDDPTDDTITGGPLGVGDGTTTAFQFVRQQGSLVGVPSYFEPIQNINAVSNVYLNGVAQSPADYTIETPGAYVVFNTAPGATVIVTADFTYLWLVRFSDAQMDFENFMFQLWNSRTVKFRQCLLNVLPM